jgi:hypothetical protein
LILPTNELYLKLASLNIIVNNERQNLLMGNVINIDNSYFCGRIYMKINSNIIPLVLEKTFSGSLYNVLVKIKQNAINVLDL